MGNAKMESKSKFALNLICALFIIELLKKIKHLQYFSTLGLTGHVTFKIVITMFS